MMHRLYVPELPVSSPVVLCGSQAHQIGRVLRIPPGDRIILFDGSGFDYLVRITALNGSEVTCDIEKRLKNGATPRRQVVLYQSVLKGDSFDLVVQKAVELGVSVIVPVISERTIVRLPQEKRQRRQQRWQKIAVEAAEQCGRGDVPEVRGVLDFQAVLKDASADCTFLFAYEREDRQGIDQVPIRDANKEIKLLLGPEGGFSQQEAEAVVNAGLYPISLGRRILRAETAALVLVTMVMDRIGELDVRRVDVDKGCRNHSGLQDESV